MDPSAGMGTPGHRADAILALAGTSDTFRREMEDFLSRAPARRLSTLGARDIERLGRFFGRRVAERLLEYVRAFPKEPPWQRIRDETSAEHAFLDHAFYRERLRKTIQASEGSETAAARAAAMGDVESLKVFIRIGLVTFPDEDLIQGAAQSIASLRYLHEAGYDTTEALAYAFYKGNVETARYAHDVIGQRFESHMKMYADFLPERALAESQHELQQLFNDNIHEVAASILEEQNEYYRHAIEMWQAEGGHAGALRVAFYELEQNDRIRVALGEVNLLIADMEAAGVARAADLRASRTQVFAQMVRENFQPAHIDSDQAFTMEDVPPHQRLFRPTHTTGFATRGDGRPLPVDEREYLARIEQADEPHTAGDLQQGDVFWSPWRFAGAADGSGSDIETASALML